MGKQKETPWSELSFGDKTRQTQAELREHGLSLDVRQWSTEEAEARESAYYMVLLDAAGNIVSKCIDLSYPFWEKVREARWDYLRAQEALKTLVAMSAEQKLQEEETAF